MVKYALDSLTKNEQTNIINTRIYIKGAYKDETQKF